jgi:vesicle-associated membrane protein 7
MADEAFGRRVPFAFLEEVKSRFTQAYGSQSATALAYAYNTEFSRVLHQQMEYFSSSNSGGDPLSQAKTDLADVRALAVQNIDAVLDRGEKIELLVDKTEGLAGDAFRFKKQASRVKHAQWVKNMKLTVVAVCVGVLILYFLVGMVCGFSLRFCRSQTGNTQPTNGPYGRRALLRSTPGGGHGALQLQ